LLRNWDQLTNSDVILATSVEMEANGEPKVEDVHETQLQVRFTTKLEDQFRVADTPFAVPSTLNRYGLSEIINVLLGLGKSELGFHSI
jgi:hypothetical protein